MLKVEKSTNSLKKLLFWRIHGVYLAALLFIFYSFIYLFVLLKHLFLCFYPKKNSQVDLKRPEKKFSGFETKLSINIANIMSFC